MPTKKSSPLNNSDFESILREKMGSYKKFSASTAPSSSTFFSFSAELFSSFKFSSAIGTKPLSKVYPPPPKLEIKLEEKKVRQLTFENPKAKESLSFFQKHGELLVSQSHDENGLKKAFRRLAKRFHPDTATLNSEATKLSSEAFICLKEAYQILEATLK